VTNISPTLRWRLDVIAEFVQTAKMLRYLAFRTLCDVTFVWFLLSWFVTRHVLYNFVIYSVYADLPKLVKVDWASEQHVMSKEMWISFCSMLLALQVIPDIYFFVGRL
jgi:very-long-chain ceramide synthase